LARFKIWFFAFWCFKLLADFGVACAQNAGRAERGAGVAREFLAGGFLAGRKILKFGADFALW